MVDARLIVVRGNSGSGKSSIVQGIRRAYGPGVVWIEQDYVRRIMFQELDEPDGANIDMIRKLAQHALGHGYHAVVEGIMPTVRYAAMLAGLARDHDGPSYFYYLDVPLEETIRRHTTREKATAFPADEMRTWYKHRDLLDWPRETIIDETSSLESTVRRILDETGLRTASSA